MSDGAMDTTVALSEQDQALFDSIGETIERAVIAGDPEPVFAVGRSLRSGMQAKGLALAKLLAMMEERWSLFRAAGEDDDFLNAAYAHMGISTQTITKYIAMWRAIFMNAQISDEIKSRLMGMPIKSLLLLTAAAREGELDWEEVSEAIDAHELRDIIRDKRGSQTSSKTALTIALDRRDGILKAKEGNAPWENIGYLNIGWSDSEGKTVQTHTMERAVERIVRTANILEL